MGRRKIIVNKSESYSPYSDTYWIIVDIDCDDSQIQHPEILTDMDRTMACSGLWPPAAIPFADDMSINFPAFTAHCQSLLRDGADGLAVLGTTSEANSLTLAERVQVIDTLIDAGIAADRLLPGTGACSVGDVVALSRHATEAGCAGVLLLPPFFYKNVPDAGLHDYVAQVIAGVGDARLKIYLYHIPQMAGTGWSLELIARLRTDFPDTVVGLKDSSGDWDNTRAVIERFPGFAVFPASEAVLTEAIALGAAGCISASANINARGISRLIAALRRGDDATVDQAAVSAVRSAVTAVPLIPAIKAVLAERTGDAGWARLRPPMRPLEAGLRAQLTADPAMRDVLDRVPK